MCGKWKMEQGKYEVLIERRTITSFIVGNPDFFCKTEEEHQKEKERYFKEYPEVKAYYERDKQTILSNLVCYLKSKLRKIIE